jgi:hypothetical protein
MPPDPNGNAPMVITLSSTQCALPIEDFAALNDGQDVEGEQLYALLELEGNTYGFNEQMLSLTDLGPPAVPGPYTCELFNDPETVSTPFWVSNLRSRSR